MFKHIEKISLWFLLIIFVSLINNFSLRSKLLNDESELRKIKLNLGEIQEHFLDLVKKECGGEDFECPDGNTCCKVGDTCCPDPNSSSGTGCCPGVTNVGEKIILFNLQIYSTF